MKLPLVLENTTTPFLGTKYKRILWVGILGQDTISLKDTIDIYVEDLCNPEKRILENELSVNRTFPCLVVWNNKQNDRRYAKVTNGVDIYDFSRPNAIERPAERINRTKPLKG